jgi:DNA-binding CsgD family transcriptional regulator
MPTGGSSLAPATEPFANTLPVERLHTASARRDDRPPRAGDGLRDEAEYRHPVVRPGDGRPGRADPGWSARLHGAADQALADLGQALYAREARLADQALADLGQALYALAARLADQDRRRLRAAIGDAAFEAGYAAGRTLDPARAADQALQGIPAERAPRAGAPGSGPGTAVPGEAASVLTPRELDVLKLIAQGSSNSDIARRLFLSEHTVHRHLANILRKLGLSSRAAAAAWGVRAGLV